MNAHLITTTAVLSMLAACTPTPAPGNNGSSPPPSSQSTSSIAAAPHAKEGELCGGIAGILCEPSLFCKYDGAYPDAGGVCVQ